MPAGRPPGSTSKPFKDTLRQVLADAESCPNHERRRLRRIVERLCDLAAGGDLQAILNVRDTMDGKPVQGHGQDSELGPVTVQWLDAPTVIPVARDSDLDATETKH